MKTVSFFDACILCQSSENPIVPILNKSGQDAVKAFVFENVMRDNVMADAFYPDAEAEACNMLQTRSTGVIEIGRFMSKSGNPVTLSVDPDWFDWTVSE